MASQYIAPVRVPLPPTARRRHASIVLAGLRRWLLRAVPERTTTLFGLRGN